MKILIFNWRCWLNPNAGGAEVFTREIARRWAKQGHELTLLTSEFAGCEHEENLDGIRVIRAGGKYSVYWKTKKYYEKNLSKDGYEFVIDEINTRPFLTPKFVRKGGQILALIHQLAREYWFYETPFPISYLGYYYLENRWLRNYADLPTLTVSESTRHDLIDLGFRRVLIVPEGLDFKPLEEVPEKEAFPVVVYAGRLKRAKRPDHAVRAIKIIKKKIPEAELWILGEGSLGSDLQRTAGDGVKFFGNPSNEERRKLIKRAWVLVNPSVREGWGLNIIEANALGTPCVGYNVPGLQDSIRNNDTGLLADNGNVQSLAKKIALVLGDDSFRNSLGKNALKYSRSFSWEKSATVFMKMMQYGWG